MANEVKELAKETAKATEDISQKIEAIQTDTRGAVEAIGQIGTIIDQINDIQNTIASAVEEQTATTNEISRNVAEAAQGGARDRPEHHRAWPRPPRARRRGRPCAASSGQLARMAAELQRWWASSAPTTAERGRCCQINGLLATQR